MFTTSIVLLSTSCMKKSKCSCFRKDGTPDGSATKGSLYKSEIKKFEDGCRSDSEKRQVAYGGYCTLN